MQLFDLTYTIIGNDDLLESDLLEKFVQMLHTIPDNERKIFDDFFFVSLEANKVRDKQRLEDLRIKIN